MVWLPTILTYTQKKAMKTKLFMGYRENKWLKCHNYVLQANCEWSVKKVQEVSVSDYFMVSYDFCRNDETIDLTVDVIFDNNKSMNITKPQLRKCLCFFLYLKLIFSLIMKFMIQPME